MNSRLQFKIIASLIIFSVIAVFGWQIYWVRGLYMSIWEKTEQNIYEAMRMADYKELFMRIDEIRKEDVKNAPEEISFKSSTQFDGENMITLIEYPPTLLDSSNRLSHYLSLMEQMEGQLHILLHETFDSIIPINLVAYDSLLSLELKEKNIHLPYELRLIQLKDSLPYAFLQFPSVDTISNSYGLYDKGYDFPVYGKKDQLYRLYIRSPEKIVFRQMGGILFTSGLILILIITSFTYLLRTILKQKTIEELKTDFTNNITHELKTPIAVAFAANDVLLNHDKNITEKQKKYMTIVDDQLLRLTGMVEQILTVSKENRTHFRINREHVKVADVLPSLIEQQKLKTDKKIVFYATLPDNFTLYADRAHLDNMISNLIENAVKYTNGNEVNITFTGTKSEKENTFSVSDNGIGISAANQKRVFDKFFRVPRGNLHNVKGFGLGLYYINDMMKKHNGSVTLSSHPGKGSSFTLHFKNK